MIPTQYKTKLPRTMVYVLNCEAISAALSGVPQEAELRLQFWFRQAPGVERPQVRPREVVRAAFMDDPDSRLPERLPEWMWPTCWKLNISALPREEATSARAATLARFATRATVAAAARTAAPNADQTEPARPL